MLALPAAILEPAGRLADAARREPSARYSRRRSRSTFELERATAALVAIGVAVASALAVGLFPVRGLITDRAREDALQAYGARHTTTKGVTRFRAALATAQVALSMALLATTGVFAQSLANIARLDLGVDIDSVVMFAIGRRDGRNRIHRHELSGPRVEEALEAIPGVSSVASSIAPLLSLRGHSRTTP